VKIGAVEFNNDLALIKKYVHCVGPVMSQVEPSLSPVGVYFAREYMLKFDRLPDVLERSHDGRAPCAAIAVEAGVRGHMPGMVRVVGAQPPSWFVAMNGDLVWREAAIFGGMPLPGNVGPLQIKPVSY
jgi:hypothetical protein